MSKRSWAAVAALLTAAAAGCASAASQAEARLATFDAGMQPDELVKRARAYAQVGDFTRAEEYYAAAIQNGGERRELMPHLLDACLRDGRYRLATEHASDHLRVYPSDFRTRYVLGTLFVALEDWPNASKQLERVVREQPTLASAHFALGSALKHIEGQRLRADNHFREYLRLEPDGPEAQQAQEQLLDSVPDEAASGPAASGPAANSPAASSPAASGPAASGPAASSPATSGPAASGPSKAPASTGPTQIPHPPLVPQ